MSTRNQAKNIQALNGGLYEDGLDRPSTFRRTIAWLTLIAYVGQPLLVTAQTTADQAAAANKRPVVDVTANGIPLVQIATPNAAGLSHNQYNQFNVDPAGLILNNSHTAVQTQQAGYVDGNPNLANGAAHVILNEVTGTGRSQLNGYIEVAGQQAEVIVANPNGITCNGCGFINANRGVLTTGTPVIGMSGSLDAFRVTGGDIQIGSAGLNGNNLSQLDLIARSVQVNGQLWGTNLNVITGSNLVDYNTLGVQVIQVEGAKPTVGIDVALLGGMYANKIRLIGTEAGVGVNSLGTLSAQAGDFYLDYQGQITLMGSTSTSGNLTIHSNTGISNTGSLYSQQATQLTSAGSINNAGNITAIGTLGINSNTDIINSGVLFSQQATQLTGSRSISNSGKLYSQQDAQLTSSGGITNSGTLSAQGNLTLGAASVNSTGALGAGINASGVATQHGNLLINTAQGQTIASGTNIAGGSFTIIATDINLANSNTNAADGISLTATAGNINLNNAVTQSVSDIILTATGGAVSNNNGMLFGSQITSHSTSFSNTAGEVYALGNLGIIATTDIINSGSLSAKGNLTLHSANLNSSGALGAGIDGSGKATQNGNIEIITSGPTVVSGQIVAGRLSTGQPAEGGNLRITATNINLSNSSTNAVSGIVLTSTAGNINLSNALTQSLGDIILTATGSVLNDQGILYGAAITSTSAGFSNSAGNVYATGDLKISSSTSFTNAGSIYSLSNANISATGGSNITNTGQMSAQGNLELVAANVNSPGTLGAGIDKNGSPSKTGNITITTLQGQTSSSGQNIAGGSFSITANNINLSSSTSNANGIILTANGGNIDLVGAKTQSVLGAIVLSATSGAVNNTDGYIFGDTVTINSDSLTNSNSSGVYDGAKGVVGAIGDITLTANSIDNTNGKIGNALHGLGTITLGTTSSPVVNLTNAGGQISSDYDLFIEANTLIGSGSLIAGRNADIRLQGDYTNVAGNVIKANNNLTFKTTGIFTNQTAIDAVGNLTVNASGIDNQTGAKINSTLTTLNAGTGDITNAGRIEGDTVETHSNNFNNTATVIGGVVSINAINVRNQYSAAMIAATQTVNFIVANALVNQDGANIYSLGDVNIGSNNVIDPVTGLVTGNTVSVTNQSATIEATNILRISTNTLTNKRTEVGVVYGPSWAGPTVVNTPTQGGPSVDSFTTTYANQQFTDITTPAAQLLSGSNMNLGGGVLNNTYSTIIAGGALNPQMTVINYGPEFLQSTTLSGTTDILAVTHHPQSGTCGYISVNCVHAYDSWATVSTAYNPPTTYANKPNGTANVDYLQYTQPGGAPKDIPTTSVAAGSISTVGSTVVAGTVTNVAPTVGAGSVSNSAPANTGTLPALTVPSSGLYTIHSQPGQQYLVVTDPRFASYSNFVSSDYMLNRLALDPELIQKRLGDGFYEQKLVTDQVTAATGNRYLGDYSNAEAQFVALLNSGVDAAEEFKLSLGVALTASQINALKHDIVWMVERNVTLSDGSTQRVLAPQVYLSKLQAADLKPDGALISANVININSTAQTASANAGNSGAFSNSGTLRANTSLSINATDITNRGTISSGGSASLIASNDILNLSGTIRGDTVNLFAGRDIRNETTGQEVTRTVSSISQTETGFGLFRIPQTPVLSVVNGTELGLQAGISATHTLNINAGRDISIVGATVKAGSDATIIAGRDLTVGVLAAASSSTTEHNAVSRNEVTQHTSSIQTGGNISLISGNDMHLTSAQLEVGKDAALVAGGDLTVDASKNSTSLSYNTGSAKGRFNDETVLGGTINAGGNIILAAMQLNAGSDGSSAGRTDGKGNITLNSAAISSKSGNITVAADANVKIGITEENHSTYTESHATGSGMLTHTTLDVRDETWRTDVIGSSLTGNNISITSGKDTNIIGSTVEAQKDIKVVAMGDVKIEAATSTYGSNHYSNERTTGLQASNAFSITDKGPETTSKARTDGTNQSEHRSSLTSTGGNLTVTAGGNIIGVGADLAATGDVSLDAKGGSVVLKASKDTLEQSSSTQTVTNPNAFTKQRLTITDTSGSITYQGGTLQGNSVKINSAGDTVMQATKVTAGTGGIDIDAGGDLLLLAAANQSSHSHTETLATDGYTFRADGSLNDTDTRRKNNKAEGQTVTNQVTSLVSGGNIKTHSGGDTLFEATAMDAQGTIHYSATGYEGGIGTDGKEYKGRKGTVTFAGVKDSTYTNVVDSQNSMPWQSSSGHGEMVETLQLANIHAGGGITYDAAGGIVVDIPVVPATPAPKPQLDAQGKPIPVVPLSPEQQAAQQQAALDNHIQSLASKPGQEWIGQLAQMAKEKPDAVKLQQVNTAAKHWDYAHEGLTAEAAAVIVIVVTYFTAGAGSSAVGTTAAGSTTTTLGGATLATTSTVAGVTTTTYTALGAAINAGFSALASQAAVSIINNQGDIGQTLNDMGSSQNVHNIVAAMLTAGVGAAMPSTNVTGVMAQTATGCATGKLTGIGCENGASTAAIMAGSTWINHAMHESMLNDSNKFPGVHDANDPSGIKYNNVTGQGSAGLNGSGDRLAGTRVDLGALGEFGTVTPPTIDNPLWTFSGKINPDTGKAFTLSDALAAQGGLTGGSQALLPTFANMPVASGSFLDKLDESFAGPHDYFGGVVWGGYDALGNANVNQPSWFRNGMAVIDIPLVTPLVIPTFLQQINLDPVVISNTVHNGSH